MKKRYRTSDGEVYEISDAEVNDFMTDFPDAIEVETYTADGEDYDISADEVSAFMTDFPGAVKKKGVSGQGSEPLTQSLPVKTVPPKVASKGQPIAPKSAAKQAGSIAQGDPFASQKAPASINYDPTIVRDSIKGVKEGLDKTYRIAQEGKRKGLFDSWNTQQAYAYIKPSVDYTDQMLGKIKDIQDPEIQSLYNELKNANENMKNMVGQAWNDGWNESSVNQYIGGLNRDISNKIDQIDRRMAELQIQKPTAQQRQAQETFQKVKITGPKKQPLPVKTEQQLKEEAELAEMPQTISLPTEQELEAREQEMTYPEKREYYKTLFESTPWLKSAYGDFENFEFSNNVKKAFEEGEDVLAFFNEKNTKAQGEVFDQNMGKRHKEVNFAPIQDIFNQVFDSYSQAAAKDPQSEEAKTLAADLKTAESELNTAYRSLDLDYLDSQAVIRPTKGSEDIDKYQALTAMVDAGQDLDDDQKQFLFDVRRQSLNAYGAVTSSKISKIKERADIAGYTKGMAELTPLIQEVVGQSDLVKYASEQKMKQAQAAKAPIQEEYGKKRRELAEYEGQLANIDAQIEQLEADYQSGGKTDQQYEDELNQLDLLRKDVYGSYEVTYSALEQLNKAMETAIAPFNNELTSIQDPFNKKVQELNNQISELKRKTGVDDSILAELDILYRDLAVVESGLKTTNAQFADQYYSEDLNRMLQEERKKNGNIFAEGTRGFIKGMSTIVTGAMKLPKAIGLEDSDKYGAMDEMYDWAVQIDKESSGTFGALQGSDVPKYLQNAYGVGGAMASIATYSTTMGVGSVIGMNGLVNSAATTYLLSAGDNYQLAIDSGMDSNSAKIFSNLKTLGDAAFEMIYRDANVFDDVVGNTIIKNITKNGLTVKQAFRAALNDLPKNSNKMLKAITMENLEESTAYVGGNILTNTANAIAGKKYFDENLTVEGANETLLTTSVATGLTRMIGRRSKLDPNSRMALFQAVQDREKILSNLERYDLSKSKISQIKKELEEAKLKLDVVSRHTNWGTMNDEQKAYAFDLAIRLDQIEKANKGNSENGINDPSLVEEAQQVREELNEALNNPQAAQEQEQIKSNTLEVLEAVKNGEDYPQMLSTHPNWNKLSDQQKKEIESLSEDLEDKQREILSLFEVGVESSTTIDQRNTIEDKISQILNNPTNDQKDIQGVSGEVREGQEPVQAEPVATEGEGEAEAGGVLQAQEEIEAKKADIEQRRQQELKDNEDILDIAIGVGGDTRTTEEKINEKYDKELAELEAPKAAAEAAPEVTPEANPEIEKIEQQRAAELEAFENDENLTEIDGEQVLLTPDGRITRDSINEKYDKQVNFQKEIETAIADVKKQQDPAYQEALRQAIDADPKASNQVHQIAAENILNGANATDAITSATQQAAQQARSEKARQAMQREGLISSDSDIQKAIENVTRALRSTGIRVNLIKDPAKFEEARKEAKASETAEGWFRSKTGEIVLSQKALEEGWGTTIVFHEGTHPILNIVRNTDKKLYDRAVKGLRDAAKKEKLDGKPNPLKDVEAWVAKAAGKKTQEQQDDEFMTETIARLASGEMEINMLPRTVKEKFIDALNKIAKFMGFKRVFFNSPDTEFRRLANQIATTLAKGEKIEKIVGKRNVKKYQAKFGSQESTSAIFDDVATKLAGLGIKIGGDKKKKTNFDVGKALKEYYKKNFKSMKIDDFGKKAVDLTSDYAVDEILFALDKFGSNSGKGWYTEDFEKALSTLAQIDPDIQNDPKVREIATVVIAIASNSTDVLTNLTRVIYAVNNYKKTGKIPTDVGSGKGASAIATGVARYNLLLDKFNGDVEKVKQFMQTVGPIKDIRQQLIDLTGKKSFAQVKKDNLATDPEWNDNEVLPGSILIFGPKIGAFYSNLSGLGGTPTIDRWCIRTIYRYRGDMMAKVLPSEIEQFKKENNLEGQSDGSVIALIEDHAKAFNNILTGRGEFKGMPKDERNKALKHFRKGSQIAAKMGNVVNEISDGLNEKIENKAQYSKDFRSFTKKVFEEAQKKIKEQTGQELQISDIQAILWIYEKELFGAMGVNQRPDSTYSSASQRLVDSIKNGVNTVEDFKNGKAKTDQKSVTLEEGPMGDLIPMDSVDYVDGLEQQPDRLNESANIQPSEPRGPKPTKAEIDTYLSEQEFFRSTSPFAWAVDAVSRETLESSSIVENEGTYAVVTEDGDIKGVFNPNVAKQREGIEPKKGTLNGLIPKAIAAGGIKLDNFDGRLTELYSKNGFRKTSSVPFNEEYAPEGWIKEKHGTPDVVAMVYDPDNKLDIEFKKFDDYGDMISYRDSFVDQAREEYQGQPKQGQPSMVKRSDVGNKRIADALGIEDIIQPSETVGRGEKLVRSGEITEGDRQIALYAIQNKMGIKTTNADMIRVSKMSPEQKIKLIEDAFQDRVKKMNPAFRDPEFINQPGTEANRFYQYAVDAKNRVLALVPKETIQPTEPGRYDKKDIPDLIERAVAGIDADLRKGMSLIEAIENNMTNQEWYPLLNDRQKRQVQSVLESTFDEEIASLPTEEQEAAEIGVDVETKNITSELEDLYYQIRDGRRVQANQAKARRDEILRDNPKLSYIYKNIDLINLQLEERGLLTKSIGCP